MRLADLIRRLEHLARANEGNVKAPVNIKIVANVPKSKSTPKQ